MSPNTSVDIVGLYGGDKCLIVGPGDQFIGITKTNSTGEYRLTKSWAKYFKPYLGRAPFRKTLLPKGPYYLIALPCDPGCKGTYEEGSGPGGPFTLR
jgi:hypothetical protein